MGPITKVITTIMESPFGQNVLKPLINYFTLNEVSNQLNRLGNYFNAGTPIRVSGVLAPYTRRTDLLQDTTGGTGGTTGDTGTDTGDTGTAGTDTGGGMPNAPDVPDYGDNGSSTSSGGIRVYPDEPDGGIRVYPDGPGPSTRDEGEKAASPPAGDPLALDLDGDGIEVRTAQDGEVVLFDHDGDGVRTGTGWLKPDDGWLVLDRNGNGIIDNGHELFGVDTILLSRLYAALLGPSGQYRRAA